MQDWSGIEAFVHAVEAGSFSLAAERLHRTRSSVAKAIARLEQRLGSRLFHRTTRTQSLTEEGQAFHEHCVRALAELEAGSDAMAHGRRQPRGRLRVSAPVLFGRHCVAPSLLRVMQQCPQLTIEMNFSDRVVDLVEEGFDLAVRIGPLPDSTTLASRCIGRQHMAICAAPAYLARHGRPRGLDELERYTAIVYGRPVGRVPWQVADEEGRIHAVSVPSRVIVDDLQTIADAAAAGMGLAWLPCWLLAPYVRRGELEVVVDNRRALAGDIHAVWPRNRYLPAKTRLAIDTLSREVPGALET